MAGMWRLLNDGVERRLQSEQLVSLFEEKKISRFARVKREPDGHWVSAEHAVAVIRSRDLKSAPSASRPPGLPVKMDRPHRRIWTLGALVSVTLVVLVWRAFGPTRGLVRPVAHREQVHDARPPLSPDPVTRTATEPIAESHVPDSSASVAPAKDDPPELIPVPAPAKTPIAVAGIPELPSQAPYADESGELGRSRRDATDREVAEFVESLERERTADRAGGRIQDFILLHQLSEKQALSVGDLKRRFADRQKRGLVRLGAKWVTPQEQQTAQAEAKKLIEQAIAMTDMGSMKSAEKLLEKASAIDGNNIEANLILGTWKGIVYLPTADAKASEANFETVLKRSPDHLGALNNSAVAEIRQKRYAQALDHLDRAAELAPQCREVGQNVGRLSILAGEGRITLTKSDFERCMELRSRLSKDGHGNSADPQRGYLLLPPYVSPADRKGGRSTDEDLVLVGQGTGFAVAPEMILTNRHVVTMEAEDQGVADQVRVTVERPDRTTVVLNGTVKAVCATDDLALVHVPKLEAAAIPVRETPVRLADEIAILGFPQAQAIGADLKFVSGRVGAANAERLMFDCVANQGNSGGPVMSRNGDVVAVYNAVLVSGRDVITQYGMGVPATAAARFIKAELGSLPSAKAVRGEWPSIVSRVRMSVFKLDVYFQSSHPAILRTLVASTGVSRWLEDPSCPACSGRGAIVCPGGCFHGDIQEVWTEPGTGTLFGQTVVVPQLMQRVTACKVCGGKGAVKCPHCVNGVDPMLRR